MNETLYLGNNGELWGDKTDKFKLENIGYLKS